MLNFKGHYGSITDNTVHGVQMDNTVRWDNTGWYTISVFLHMRSPVLGTIAVSEDFALKELKLVCQLTS